MANPSRLEKLRLTSNIDSASAPKVVVQEANGELNNQTINSAFNKNFGLSSDELISSDLFKNLYSIDPVIWTATAFAKDAVVFYGGKQWIAESPTVAGDIPSVSSKWTEITIDKLYFSKAPTVHNHDHNTLTNLQGGAVGDYQHVTTAEKATWNGKAGLASPSFTGTPTAPTATAGTNTTQIATTAFVTSAVSTADAGNVKLTGAQTITGTKTFSSSINGSINGSWNSNSSCFQTIPSGAGGFIGINLTNNADQNTSHNSIRITGNSVANLIDISNNGTGLLWIGRNNGVATSFISKLGEVTATSFIKSGATANNLLLAGGGDIAQNTFQPAITGLTANYLPKWNGSGFGDSTWREISGRLTNGSDNGVDVVQVNGTISASPATASNQVVVKSQLDSAVAIDYTFFTQVYGIQRDLTIAAPEWTRIGNMSLHATLPVQSNMRRCLVTDAGVVTYLKSDDSTKKEDGSAADLTGAAGQVMVEIPEYYRRFSQKNNIQEVLFSLSPFTGAERIPKKYVSAFKAAVERATNKLSSVVNTTTAYRGGDNNATVDALPSTRLGKPATNISRTNFELYASNRGTNWWSMDYQVRKDVFWLITCEYATNNHQAAYDATLTVEGYKKGGFGVGLTDINGTDWNTFNGYNPLVNCGRTTSLGNNSGVVSVTLNDFPTSGLSKNTQVFSYRGIENFFGDIWEWTSGINIKTNNGSAVVFVKETKSLNSNVNYYNYRPIGDLPISNGFISKIIFGAEGDIMPKEVIASSSTGFTDYYFQSNPASETLRGVLFSGGAGNGSTAGSVYSSSYNAPSPADANVGSRLCFLP